MVVGWGVLGTGSHVIDRMAPALSMAEGTQLAAVCSRQATRAREVANRFGFARAYDSYEDMLRDDSVEIIYICTPNALHAEQAIQAARAGKHVLVEKPMALSRGEAEAMVEACETHGVRLGVGFHLRHHPGHVEARRLISEGVIGDPVLFQAQWIVASPMAEGWWRDPNMVGAYITMARGVHLMDLVFYLSGREPEEVMMMSDGQRSARELEDTTVATIRLKGDVFASLVASRRAGNSHNGFRVYGTEGWIDGTGTVGHVPTGTIKVATCTLAAEMDIHAPSLLQTEVEAFNLAVKGGTAPDASGIDGLRVVRVTEALLESARSGRTIRP